MSKSSSLRCVAIGNRYISGELMAGELMRSIAGTGLEIDPLHLDLPYPGEDTIPLPEEPYTDIRAYWEAPDRVVARHEHDSADETLSEYVGPVDALVAELGDAHIVLVHNAPLSRNTLRSAQELRVVGTLRTTPNNINITELNDRRLPLFTTPSRNAQSVAEHILGALIAHVRGIVDGAQLMASGIWSFKPWISDHAGIQLSGRTCGLIGFGKVGSAFARMASGVGMRLLVSDPYSDPDEIERISGSKPVSKESIFAESDVVVLTARLNAENQRFIDESAFRAMKRSAVFVNTARSRLVDQLALRRALEEHWIAGAVIDVYDSEPPHIRDDLMGLPNTLLTPHQAGATRDTAEHGTRILAESVAGYLTTGSLHNCFNSEVLRAG